MCAPTAARTEDGAAPAAVLGLGAVLQLQHRELPLRLRRGADHHLPAQEPGAKLSEEIWACAGG